MLIVAGLSAQKRQGVTTLPPVASTLFPSLIPGKRNAVKNIFGPPLSESQALCVSVLGFPSS